MILAVDSALLASIKHSSAVINQLIFNLVIFKLKYLDIHYE